MKTSVFLLCLLAITLFVFGCGEEPPVVSDGSTANSLLPSSTAPSQFYTSHWAIENDWAVALEWIDTRTGLGTSLWLYDISPDPEYPDAFFAPYGVAFDVDGTMYTIVSWFDGVQEHSKARLARVDLQTGALTYIGPTHPLNFAGPEIDACGNAYATGFTVGPPETGGEPTYVWGDSYLYRFDKYTGEATRVGDTGHTEWMDMAFDSQGRLWSTFANDLYLLDPQTGASTFVTHVTGVPQNNVPGVCPEDWPWMEIMSIAFDDNDVLWATAMKGFSECDEVDAPLMHVDVNTGVATVVGYTHEGYNHGGDIAPSKVRVCHRKGNGSYVTITIDMSALPAHRAHGDIVPGVDGNDCDCPDRPDDKHMVN
ncbi:MAG: hypothetical protein OEY32_15130 [Candidatus Krumholzibacteria bacterium]|nr:hypothetical protein [Candidatus Krumholzibacteria bacterium]